MSLHPSQRPDGRSMLDRLVPRVWPGRDNSGDLASRQDAQLYRTMMWTEFRLILGRTLGDNRDYLALGDEEAFGLVMEVVWNGRTHAEVADGVCLANDLVERHREYAESGALSTFLLLYSTLHHRISALIHESSIIAERARLRGAPKKGA